MGSCHWSHKLCSLERLQNIVIFGDNTWLSVLLPPHWRSLPPSCVCHDTLHWRAPSQSQNKVMMYGPGHSRRGDGIHITAGIKHGCQLICRKQEGKGLNDIASDWNILYSPKNFVNVNTNWAACKFHKRSYHVVCFWKRQLHLLPSGEHFLLAVFAMPLCTEGLPASHRTRWWCMAQATAGEETASILLLVVEPCCQLIYRKQKGLQCYCHFITWPMQGT